MKLFRCLLQHWHLLAFTIGIILENELQEFVKFWNSHRIRNKLSNAPCGIPNDLYDMPETIVPGTIEYSLEFESELWKYALQNESALAPPLVDVTNKILQATLGIHRGNINVDNCFQVFQLLVRYFTD